MAHLPKIKIGVDARLLALQLTGIGRYTVEMLRALQAQDAALRLYTPAPPLLLDAWQRNVVLRHGHSTHRLGRMLWSQTALPKWAAQDVVDVFWGATHRLPQTLPDRMARVVTIHDLVWRHAPQTMRPLSRWMEARLMPQAIRLADVIMADSQSTADDVQAEFPAARGRVRVVHLGSTRLAHARGKEALRQWGVNRPYVLAVGTLEPRKNLRHLLQAYATLPQAFRAGHQLLLVGGKGWGGGSIATLVAELELENDVVVCGYVNDEELATLYTHALCLALPSLYEGFGLPLVEAMSCGTPVITSNLSSLPEVAGPAGLLVDPYDVGSIRAALCKMMDPLHDKAHWGALAKAQAAKFSWEKAASKAMEVFAEAIQERKGKLRHARSAIF